MASANELIGREPRGGRGFYLLGGRDPSQWNVDPGGPIFTVMLAIDEEQHSYDVLQDLSRRLGRAGMGSLCAWGPGCELVHDTFDFEYVDAEMAGEARLNPMTSWHETESLAEVLWDAVDVSWHPDQDDVAPVYCGTDNSEWEREIRAWLGDVEALRVHVCGPPKPPILLGHGRAADVFLLETGQVLKRDREGRNAEHEAGAMRYAAAHGFPVPEVFSADGTDLVMAGIAGRTMTAELVRRPWRVTDYAKLLADLHNRLHSLPPPAQLSPRLDGEATMVHGDLHPDNVLLPPEGPVVIDWANAGRGRAEDDVALAWLIIATSDMPGGRAARLFARAGRQLFLDVFLDAVDRDAAAARIPVIAEKRLTDPHVLPHEAEAIRRVVESVTR